MMRLASFHVRVKGHLVVPEYGFACGLLKPLLASCVAYC